MKKLSSNILEWVVCIVVAIIVTTLIKTFLFDFIKVSGSSMYPTLNDNDKLIVEKISIRKKEFKYGDIIIFDTGHKKNNIYIKRIIGLPGDNIELKDGKLYVNGKENNEPYLKNGNYTKSTQESKIKLDKNHIYVLGDNRDASEDSRELGPIPIEKVKGHAIQRILPLKSWGAL